MSDEQIKEHMIEFIKEKERDVVNDKLRGSSGDNKSKSDIVNSILSELDKEVPDEN
ncbi:MAG: hypothetical protein IKQ71_10435 [Lachnospiraceae bacterium]|nr:hypothetical protein [Lachnospiraceae bacterium]